MKICRQKLSSSTKLKKKTGRFTSKKAREQLRNVDRAKRSCKAWKVLFYIAKYANLNRSCFFRRCAFCGKISVLHVRHALLHSNTKFPY